MHNSTNAITIVKIAKIPFMRIRKKSNSVIIHSEKNAAKRTADDNKNLKLILSVMHNKIKQLIPSTFKNMPSPLHHKKVLCQL